MIGDDLQLFLQGCVCSTTASHQVALRIRHFGVFVEGVNLEWQLLIELFVREQILSCQVDDTLINFDGWGVWIDARCVGLIILPQAFFSDTLSLIRHPVSFQVHVALSDAIGRQHYLPFFVGILVDDDDIYVEIHSAAQLLAQM